MKALTRSLSVIRRHFQWWVVHIDTLSPLDDEGWRRGQRSVRQCSGMSPEEVTVDLAGTDEFSLSGQSLARTDP
jgi:hypothetical protein